MSKCSIFIACILCTIIFNVSAFANVRLPAVISSGMVLQQKSTVKLWGWSEPNEKINIKVSWDTATYTTTGSGNAKWSIDVKTPVAGGPYTISIEGQNSITLDDVMIGEVWVCSGQSNMEMSLAWGIKLYDEDMAAATNKNIRFFHVPRTTAEYPQDDLKGSWASSTPEAMKRFSAVAYFFGKKISDELNVPVGLINVSWGGTPAEVWTPADEVNNDAVLNAAAKNLKEAKGWPVKPGLTYNAMISPLTSYQIAGAIWYQGEGNVGNAKSYNALFSTMIQSWRKAWAKELPFYFVQIAPFAGYGKDNVSSAILREAQSKTLSLPHTGMVVTTDLVDNIDDIHPHNKKDVGLRLANYALSQTYGRSASGYKSPQFKGMEVEKNKVRISFDNADNGLMIKGKSLTDFYIAGEDKNFVPATAKIDGKTVLVWSKEVKNPVAVRFGFTNAAMPNLYNKEGLPADPFRTDNWEVNTVNNNQ